MINDGISPIPQWKPPRNTKILDEKVALYPTRNDPEAEVFNISFKYYNDRECEISILEKNRAKKALENFKIIGRCYDFPSLMKQNINIKKVKPIGDYRKLFKNGITEDTTLREHKIQGDARLFYFIAEKIFFIIAITNNHYETDKHR